MNKIIELRKLNKSYSVGKETERLRVLTDISFSADEGEIVAVMGKSGSGKSTLLNILGCTDGFDSGEYLFCGKDVGKLKGSETARLRAEKIRFVFQDYALIDDETVLQNVGLPLFFTKGVKLGEIAGKVDAALSALNISELANKKVNCLSGGQKQRTAIARAIVNNPMLILADEPTGALDSKTADEVMNALLELNKTGVTVIIVTHDEDIAKRCGKIYHIADGKIGQELPPQITALT